jgi:DNA-binding NtrC family response regulator
MADGSVVAASEQTRLLLIHAGDSLSDKLAGPLAEACAVVPVVVELNTGRLGLDLLRSSSFDVVAADVDTIGDIADGVDDRIAKLARAAAGALVIILTSDASISVAIGAMRAGAHDCVPCSIEPEQLVDRMGELARRHGKARTLLGRSIEGAAAATTPSIPVMRDLILPMWRQEQRIIEDAIQSFAGNIALAAAALELSPSTIYRKRQAWAELEDRRAALASVSAR